MNGLDDDDEHSQIRHTLLYKVMSPLYARRS